VNDPRVAPAASRFGDVATGYERARPDYPAAIVEALVAQTALGPGVAVLDLAAGTGKLTRQLVSLGADVVAVEPSAGMRDQLEAAVPTVPVLDGTAETIPVADRSFDVVTVAQAFHWFDTRPALDELVRVLRPGGWLALLWNEPPAGGWAAEHWALRHRLTGFTGDYPGRGWEAVLDADRRFGPRTVTTVVSAITTTVEREIDESASRSYVHTLDPVQQQRVLDELAAFLAGHPDVTGRAELTYERPCTLHLCHLLG
jgi:ubiquinone/menaquinone biosynthesis C-methylase UbiE